MQIFPTVFCTGCRTCELACSFHHTRQFFPSIASIRIQMDSKKGEIMIVRYDRFQGAHLACDCREGLEFCLKYCPAIARDELRAVLNQRKK